MDKKTKLSLELFNAVPKSKEGKRSIISRFGIIVEPSASYKIKEIEEFYEKKVLSGLALNSTFYGSWEIIKDKSDLELLIDQLLHYISTYGTGFDDRYTWIPNDPNLLDIPENKVIFYVVRGYSDSELTQKCWKLLESGIALSQDTIQNLVDLLLELNYTFDGSDLDRVKNKEAQVQIAYIVGKVPNDGVAALRYISYLLTNKKSALLMNNDYAVREFKNNSINTNLKSDIVKGIMNLSEDGVAAIFNRYKRFLLSLKTCSSFKDSKITNKINRISKKSKTLHTPMKSNILNRIGNCTLKELEDNRNNLRQANFFQLARAIDYLRKDLNSTAKVFRIRNGKSHVKTYSDKRVPLDYDGKIAFLYDLLRERFSLDGKVIYIPENVDYAVPVSEKKYIGNVPLGTLFRMESPTNIGIHWRNDWGAHDIDLSATNTSGEVVSWHTTYKGLSITHSGDVTNAPNGASEYLRIDGDANELILITTNVYSGSPTSELIIILGEGDDSLKKNYIMDPNNVLFSAPVKCIQRSMILGMVFSKDNENYFSPVIAANGNNRITQYNDKMRSRLTALQHEAINAERLETFITNLGGNVVRQVPSDGDYIDLSTANLEKDTIIKIFLDAEKKQVDSIE